MKAEAERTWCLAVLRHDGFLFAFLVGRGTVAIVLYFASAMLPFAAACWAPA